jgi:hypothetical protein
MKASGEQTSAYFSNLKFEAICSSEASVDFQRATRCDIPALPATCFQAGILLVLFFGPEDGGEIILRKVS